MRSFTVGEGWCENCKRLKTELQFRPLYEPELSQRHVLFNLFSFADPKAKNAFLEGDG